MSDNESECDIEYIERINEMYDLERKGLNDYLEMINNNEENSLPNEIEETSTQTYVNYPGVETLSDDLELATNNYHNGNIHICTYYINKSGKVPFLQYILRKYDETHEIKKDMVTFPSFFYERGFPVMYYVNLILEIIRTSYRIKTGIYEYKGFINNGNQFYVFYDFSECGIGCHDLRRMNDLWLVTMDEILNHKKVCNFPIDKKVTEFLSDPNNLKFTYLTDRDNNIYEEPIVAYVGLDVKKIDFTCCFGEIKSLKEKLKEPYYYFTDYQNAFKIIGFTKRVEDCSKQNNVFDLNSNKVGLVRFALFTGYVKIFSENNKGNEEDKLYNSIYISDDDGHPTWALKKYNQQCPLTCHYINKPVLGEEWNNDNDYFII